MYKNFYIGSLLLLLFVILVVYLLWVYCPFVFAAAGKIMLLKPFSLHLFNS